jgi:hypothetical protein
MSWVANVLLMVSGTTQVRAGTRPLAAGRRTLARALRTSRRHRRRLHQAPRRDCWGGWKNPECRVWAGALNHADLPAVIEHIGTMHWEHPEAVQLLIQDQDQEQSYFRLWTWRDGRMQQYVPAPSGDDDLVY